MNPQQAQNDMQTPGTGIDMQFTPSLPSQLLLGSPFEPGTPAALACPQQQNVSSPIQQRSPQLCQTLISPSTYGAAAGNFLGVPLVFRQIEETECEVDEVLLAAGFLQMRGHPEWFRLFCLEALLTSILLQQIRHGLGG
jgi:hypothetical protein